MEQVNPKGMPPHKSKGRQVLFIKEGGHFSRFDRNTEKSPRQKDEEPGKQWEIVGGGKPFSNNSEREEQAAFQKRFRMGQFKQARNAEVAVFHPTGHGKQQDARADSRPERNLVQKALCKREKQHTDAEQVEDSKQNRLTRHYNSCDVSHNHTEGKALDPAFEVAS